MQSYIASTSTGINQATERPPVPPKKHKFQWMQWTDYPDDSDAANDVARIELQRYLAQSVPMDCAILDWWKRNADAYPNLSQVARRILSCPARAASSERVFSRARQLVTYKRNRLHPRTLDDLIVVGSC